MSPNPFLYAALMLLLAFLPGGCYGSHGQNYDGGPDGSESDGEPTDSRQDEGEAAVDPGDGDGSSIRSSNCWSLCA